MVTCLKNIDGYITAYIEWYVLNEKTQFDNYGKYCWVADLWIHESQRGKETLKKLVGLMDADPKGKTCLWVYWKNEKHNERLTRMFLRSRLAKLGE